MLDLACIFNIQLYMIYVSMVHIYVVNSNSLFSVFSFLSLSLSLCLSLCFSLSHTYSACLCNRGEDSLFNGVVTYYCCSSRYAACVQRPLYNVLPRL